MGTSRNWPAKWKPEKAKKKSSSKYGKNDVTGNCAEKENKDRGRREQ